MTNRLRITGGTRRGRKLLSPPVNTIRPASDLVRQAVFNMLGESVAGSVFYDVFAGTGIVGLEALSRGARRAVFVESDRRQLSLIKRNLDRARFGAEGALRGVDAYAWARHFHRVEPATIIFLGPPYPLFQTQSDRLGVLIAEIQDQLADPDVLVLQFPRGQKSLQLPNLAGWHRVRNYGKTSIGIWRPVPVENAVSEEANDGGEVE